MNWRAGNYNCAIAKYTIFVYILQIPIGWQPRRPTNDFLRYHYMCGSSTSNMQTVAYKENYMKSDKILVKACTHVHRDTCRHCWSCVSLSCSLSSFNFCWLNPSTCDTMGLGVGLIPWTSWPLFLLYSSYIAIKAFYPLSKSFPTINGITSRTHILLLSTLGDTTQQ